VRPPCRVQRLVRLFIETCDFFLFSIPTSTSTLDLKRTAKYPSPTSPIMDDYEKGQFAINNGDVPKYSQPDQVDMTGERKHSVIQEGAELYGALTVEEH
jgi:hypothetical protein